VRKILSWLPKDLNVTTIDVLKGNFLTHDTVNILEEQNKCAPESISKAYRSKSMMMKTSHVNM